MNPDPPELDRLISAKEMSRITGKSLPTLWRWRRKGLLPSCVRMPSGGIAWRASEVVAWLDDLSSNRQ